MFVYMVLFLDYFVPFLPLLAFMITQRRYMTKICLDFPLSTDKFAKLSKGSHKIRSRLWLLHFCRPASKIPKKGNYDNIGLRYLLVMGIFNTILLYFKNFKLEIQTIQMYKCIKFHVVKYSLLFHFITSILYKINCITKIYPQSKCIILLLYIFVTVFVVVSAFLQIHSSINKRLPYIY